jgi:hypothetical protein
MKPAGKLAGARAKTETETKTKTKTKPVVATASTKAPVGVPAAATGTGGSANKTKHLLALLADHNGIVFGSAEWTDTMAVSRKEEKKLKQQQQ